MAERKQIPGINGLFTWPSDAPRLIGSRCEACGTYFFPSFAQFHKPDCAGGPVEEVPLSDRGRLVSYTIQYFPPPLPFIGPDPYVPFAVGTVAIPEGLQIPGQMTGCETEEVKVGIDVKIVVEKLYLDEEGNEILTWKFRPLHQ